MELQFCGLVEAVENLGMFGSDVGPGKLLEAYEIRELFEGLAARRCYQFAFRADMGRLAELADRIFDLGRAGRRDEKDLLDRRFRQFMIAICANTVLEGLTEGYRMGAWRLGWTEISHKSEEHLGIVATSETN